MPRPQTAPISSGWLGMTCRHWEFFLKLSRLLLEPAAKIEKPSAAVQTQTRGRKRRPSSEHPQVFLEIHWVVDLDFS